MVKPSSRCRTTVSTTTRSDRGRCGVNSGEVSGRYKGVRMRKWGKWVAEVRQPNSRDRIWLGSYERPDEAARAYDAAVFCLRGPSAVLNFPDSPPQIPSAADLSPPQIREAALRHARGNTTSPEGEEEEKHADAEESWVAPATTFVNSPQMHGGGSSNLVIPLRDQRYSYLPSAAAAEQRGGGEDIRITGGGYYQLPRVWSF